MATSEQSNISTTKVGARFTQAELDLLELVTKALGVSTSSYIRSAVKSTLLDDFLSMNGHHSSFRSADDVIDARRILSERMQAVRKNINEIEELEND